MKRKNAFTTTSNAEMTTAPRTDWGRLDFLFDYRNFTAFIALCLIQVFLFFAIQQVVVTSEVIYDSLVRQMAADRALEVLNWRDTYQWLNYLLIPLGILLQVGLVTICLRIGTVLSEKAYSRNIRFGELFGITLKASFVYLLAPMITILLVGSGLMEVSTLDDVAKLDMFSLLGILGPDAVAPWLVHFAKSINLFEVGFWLLLAGGLAKYLGVRYGKAMSLVAATYGSGLVLYLLTIMFLSLSQAS